MNDMLKKMIAIRDKFARSHDDRQPQGVAVSADMWTSLMAEVPPVQERAPFIFAGVTVVLDETLGEGELKLVYGAQNAGH